MRQLRESLGLNQADFGRRIKRSLQSVQNYERGMKVPGEVLQRLAALAQQEGLADIASRLHDSAEPGEAAVEIKTRVVISGASESRGWHRLLDEILESGNSPVITALEDNLQVYAQCVRAGREAGQRKGRGR